MWLEKAGQLLLTCKLLHRNMSPLILRLLIYMYTNQELQVKWSGSMSDKFNVSNGVKQGGVVSPILFAVYMDDLLLSLEQNGVGCHMGEHFTGALAFADDLTLISPTRHGLKEMVSICEDYASEHDIKFNGSKSQLLAFRGNFE